MGSVSIILSTAEDGSSSGLTISDATAVVGLLITVAGITGGFVLKYFLSRRSTTGQVDNSAAETLWNQAQSMREMLLTEKQKAEDQLSQVADQRDKLLANQATQVLPMLTAINESLAQIASGIGTLLTKVDEILDGREQRRGTSHRKEAPSPVPDHQRSSRGAE